VVTWASLDESLHESEYRGIHAMDIGLRVCGRRNPVQSCPYSTGVHRRSCNHLRRTLGYSAMNSHLHFGRFAFSRRALEYFPVELVVDDTWLSMLDMSKRTVIGVQLARVPEQSHCGVTAKLGEKREKSRLYCVDKYREYGKRHAFPLLERVLKASRVAVSSLSLVPRGPRGAAERPRSPVFLPTANGPGFCLRHPLHLHSHHA
jgi:hypothetical protein